MLTVTPTNKEGYRSIHLSALVSWSWQAVEPSSASDCSIVSIGLLLLKPRGIKVCMIQNAQYKCLGWQKLGAAVNVQGLSLLLASLVKIW